MVEGGVGAADATDEDEQGTGVSDEETGGNDEGLGGNDPGTGGTDEEGGAGADDLTDGADQDMEDLDEEQEAAANSGGAQHSPSSPIDCASVSEPSPGAVILFPDADDPASLEAGPGPVTVEVAGCSDTFEANLQYDAFHGQDTSPTLSGFTSGGTLGTWDAFSSSETYWTPGSWTVAVFVDDAESGNRVEYDEVTFTVD